MVSRAQIGRKYCVSDSKKYKCRLFEWFMKNARWKGDSDNKKELLEEAIYIWLYNSFYMACNPFDSGIRRFFLKRHSEGKE